MHRLTSVIWTGVLSSDERADQSTLLPLPLAAAVVGGPLISADAARSESRTRVAARGEMSIVRCCFVDYVNANLANRAKCMFLSRPLFVDFMEYVCHCYVLANKSCQNRMFPFSCESFNKRKRTQLWAPVHSFQFFALIMHGVAKRQCGNAAPSFFARTFLDRIGRRDAKLCRGPRPVHDVLVGLRT